MTLHLALLLLGAALLPVAAAAQDTPPPLSPPEGIESLDAAWQAALADVVTADAAYLPDPAPYAVTAFDTAANASGAWALAVIVPAAVVEGGWENLDLDQLIDVLVLRTPGGAVTGHVRAHPAFLDLARRVPKALVDYAPLLAAAVLEPSAQQPATGIDYRFPWTEGQTWWLGSGWHGGYGPDALDFSPLTDENPAVNSAVLAAAGGTLRMACQNDGEQRLLWIDHSSGERTGYLHLDRASVAAAVEDPGLVGQIVPQGAYLGLVYRGSAKKDGQCPAGFPDCTFNTLCGYGNAAHVHFLAPNRTATIDGLNIGAIGDGAAGSRFTSTNVRGGLLPDTTPPTLALAAPLPGSPTVSPLAASLPVTITATDSPASSPAVTAAGASATDAGTETATPVSGIAAVAVRLSWQDTSGAWHSSPSVDAMPAGENTGENTYVATLPTCSPALRIPHNAPLRLDLVAVDQAGNRAEVAGAGVFRFAYPDLDADCAVGLRDLLDVAAAVAGRLAVLPGELRAYDIDNDGLLTPADAAALAAELQASPLPGGGHAGRSLPGRSLPGSRHVTFALQPAPAGLAIAQSLAVTGTTVYVADWRSGGLAVIDLATALTPTLAARLPLSARTYAATAADGSVFVADPYLGEPAIDTAAPSRLWLLAAAPPLTPTVAASMTLAGEVQQVAIAPSRTVSDLLYVAGGTAGLHVVDVTAPQTPTLLATLAISPSAAAVAVFDHPSGTRLALLAARSGGLVVATVQNPARPEVLGALATRGPALGVTAAITGGQAIAYVAAGLGGVQVIDLTTPAAPQLLGTYATASSANDLFLDGTILYVAGGWEGVLALDVADGRRPHLIGAQPTLGYVYDLQPSADLLYVAAGDAGMQVLRTTVESGPPYAVFVPLAGKGVTP